MYTTIDIDTGAHVQIDRHYYTRLCMHTRWGENVIRRDRMLCCVGGSCAPMRHHDQPATPWSVRRAQCTSAKNKKKRHRLAESEIQTNFFSCFFHFRQSRIVIVIMMMMVMMLHHALWRSLLLLLWATIGICQRYITIIIIIMMLR